jgi:hypothetical protein
MSGTEESGSIGKISRGWQLTKMSLRVIRKDKEILIFPVLSGLIMLLILGSFIGGIFLTSGSTGVAEGSNGWMLYAFGAIYYFICFFVAFFFNACMIGCATIRMNGGDPTVADGFRIAGQNLGRLLLWAIIAATVGLIISAIQHRVGFIGRFIMGLVGVAWTVVTYFVVPVLIYEKLGPWASVKRSASILKKSWGEALVGNLGIGIIFAALMIPGILAIIAGVYVVVSSGLAAAIVVWAVAIVYIVIVAIVATAAESILVAALYRYATTGKVSEDFAGMPFDRPFVT